MRSLICLALLLFSSVPVYAEEIVYVPLNQNEILKLQDMNAWINQNVDTRDCPTLSYFSVMNSDRKKEQVVLGYEVIAECPEAPTPRLYLYFDAEQYPIEFSGSDLN